MTKQDLARSLAKQSHRSRGQAADSVDIFVYRLLKELKQAQTPPDLKQGGTSAPVLPLRPGRES